MHADATNRLTHSVVGVRGVVIVAETGVDKEDGFVDKLAETAIGLEMRGAKLTLALTCADGISAGEFEGVIPKEILGVFVVFALEADVL